MNYEAELASMSGYGDAITPDALPGDQQSIEWLYARCGHVTASRFGDLMGVLKSGKEPASRRNYRTEVAVSRLIQQPIDHYLTFEMKWGIEHEATARMAYEAHTGAMVDQCGFIHHPTIKWCGGSPDGLVDSDGMIEIKCPTSALHVQTLMTNICEHWPQIEGLLAITRRQWCDFVSYDPRMPEGLKLYVQRIKRNEIYIEELTKNIFEFLRQVQEQQDVLSEISKRNQGENHNVAH